MSFTALDWTIFLAVPLLAWLLATWARRKAGLLGTYRGYFLAQGLLGTGSVAATYIGANLTFTSIFMMLCEESFHRGWWVLVIPLFWILGTLLFLAGYPRLRPHLLAGRTLHQTLGHVFAAPRLQKWASFWTIIAFIGTVTLEFYGGIFLVNWAGVPLFHSVAIVLFLAFVVTAFTVSGGMRGVAVADIFLDLASLASVIILLFALRPHLDLSASIRRDLAAPVTEDHILFVIAMLVLIVPAQFCTLDSWQRLLAWKHVDRAPTGWLLGGSLLLVLAYSTPIAIGAWLRETGPGVAPGAEPLQLALSAFALPPGLLGLCFAGLAGAMLSTADELLNCASLSLLADLWRIPLKKDRPRAESERLFSRGKLFTAIFGFLSAALAVMALRYGREIRDLAVATFSAQIVFAWPLLIALLTPRLAPHLARSAVISMGAAGLVAFVLVSLSWATGDRELAEGAPIASFLVAGLILGPMWGWVSWRHRASIQETSDRASSAL